MTILRGHRLVAEDFPALENPTRVGVVAQRVANQSMPSGGSGTPMSFDTVGADNSPSFITVPSDTLTVPAGAGGIYKASFFAVGAISMAGRGFVQINFTSSTYPDPGGPRAYMDTVNEDRAAISFSVPLAAGDTVKGLLFHLTGSNQNATGYISLYRTGP
jgi:hypothetical protein